MRALPLYPVVLTSQLTPAERRNGDSGEQRDGKCAESHWSDSNRRPLDYESRALPLSYSGVLIGKKLEVRSEKAEAK
jgi:hypothetical protein